MSHEITRVRPGTRSTQQTLCGYCGDPVAMAGDRWEHYAARVKPAHRFRLFTELADLEDDVIAATLGIGERTVRRYRTRFRKGAAE